MVYNKYYLQKKQVSYDNGLSWEDVTPTETRQGEFIDSYETLSACEGVVPYSGQYFTIESLENGNNISFSVNSIDYSTDSGVTWSTLTTGNTITLDSGGTAIFKATGLTPTLIDGIGRFSCTKTYNVYGNIMSLVYGDNFATATTMSNYQFLGLFNNSNVLISAENLILPATTSLECYHYMFQYCSNLIAAPALPATTLADWCYAAMFYGCYNLTTAPVLSATTLADYCYYSMFQSCTSLSIVPSILPATTLAEQCYRYMFYGCSSLTTAPELPATTLSVSCYDSMFRGCTGLTTAPDLPATTLADYCYRSMFDGCISLTTAPELPATTLADYCYRSMFSGCTSLNYINRKP